MYFWASMVQLGMDVLLQIFFTETILHRNNHPAVNIVIQLIVVSAKTKKKKCKKPESHDKAASLVTLPTHSITFG